MILRGAERKSEGATHQPKRILAVKLADLGDLVNVTPALQALRAAHPQAKIDLLTLPSSAALLRGCSFVDEILTYDKFTQGSIKGMLNPRSLAGNLRFFLGLASARYDTFLLFQHCTTRAGTIKYAVLSLASMARTKAGLDGPCKPFLTHHAPDLGFGGKHEADYWLSVASLAGAETERDWYTELELLDAHRERAKQLLFEVSKEESVRLIAIHTGAGAYSKARIWPVERFADVARGLVNSKSATIIVLGGPDEIKEAQTLTQLIGAGERVLNLAGRTSIHETAAVIEQCALFVGNDSGPMHIAAAVGTPVVAVFGPSNKEAWGPYSPPGAQSKHTVISRDLPCQPCFYRGDTLGLKDGCGPRPCLTHLQSGRVLRACIETLEKGNYEKQ